FGHRWRRWVRRTRLRNLFRRSWWDGRRQLAFLNVVGTGDIGITAAAGQGGFDEAGGDKLQLGLGNGPLLGDTERRVQHQEQRQEGVQAGGGYQTFLMQSRHAVSILG